MKLSVIILNYNVRYFLEQCILSVQKAIALIDAEIIVIDNNSSDESCAMVKEQFPSVLLIENKENVGFSKANNQAVKEAKGEYVCILNPDTAISENTFTTCLAYAESVKNLGVLGVYLMDGTGAFLPESKRNIPTPKVSLLKLLGFVKKYYASQLFKEDSGKVEVLVGAFMLLKKNIYNEVGGFNEDYFMYGEDIDFSYKIIKKGYQNHYLGNTTILHYKGESTQKDKVYLDRFYGAMQIFYSKHFSKHFILNNLVKMGVFIAKKLSLNANFSKKQSHFIPKKVYVFSENFQFFKLLKENLDFSLTSASKSILNNKDIHNSLLIFDVDYIPYSQIFRAMKNHQGLRNQYRIKPSGCNFILGSDQSDQKGSVTIFS